MDHMDFTYEQAAAYLAAMIDGEGCVEYGPLPNAKKSWRRRVRITNTSPGIISAIEDACRVLDLHYTKHERAGTRKQAWEINFPGPSITRMAEILRLADDGKRERLRAAASYSARYVRDPRTGRIVGSEVQTAV